MPQDHSKKLDALKQISTLLGKKTEVPAELWPVAELKPGSRLKDVNNAIATTKKMVSFQTKAKQKAEEEEFEDDADPKKVGFLKHESKEEAKANVRREGRDKKVLQNQVHAGDFDLGGDHLYYNEAGDLSHV